MTKIIDHEALLVKSQGMNAPRRQTDWALPQMWWEMTFGAVGAGAFLVSAASGSTIGMIVGWVLVAVLKGVLLLADLGRPERVWRVFAKPRTSWIARGSWAFAVFSATGLVACALRLFNLWPSLVGVAAGVACIASVILISYDGFFLMVSTGVYGWHSGALPLLFAADALLVGSALVAALSGSVTPALSWLVLATAVAKILAAWSYVVDIGSGLESARISWHLLTQGSLRPMFVFVGLGVGSGVPLVIAAASFVVSVNPVGWAAAVICAAFGVWAIRVSVLKAGVHAKLS